MADTSNPEQRITATIPVPGGSLTIDSSTPGSAIREPRNVRVAISEQLAHTALDDERRRMDFEKAAPEGTSLAARADPAHELLARAPAAAPSAAVVSVSLLRVGTLVSRDGRSCLEPICSRRQRRLRCRPGYLGAVRGAAGAAAAPAGRIGARQPSRLVHRSAAAWVGHAQCLNSVPASR